MRFFGAWHLLFLCIALSARAEDLPSSPGWTLKEMSQEQEPEQNVYNSWSTYFELQPPDGRPPLSVSPSIASRLRSGEILAPDFYSSQSSSKGKAAGANAPDSVINSTLTREDGRKDEVVAIPSQEPPGKALRASLGGSSGGLGGGSGSSSGNYGAGAGGNSRGPASAASSTTSPSTPSSPPASASSAGAGIPPELLKDDLSANPSAREIPTDNLSTTGKVPSGSPGSSPATSVVWPPPRNCLPQTNYLGAHCDLPAGNHGSSVGGSCNEGFSGACAYTCNNGTYGSPFNNSCQPNCAAQANYQGKHCDLPAGRHGNSIGGSCSEGFSGACSYTCNAGTYGDASTNTCVPKCPAHVNYEQKGCDLAEKLHGASSGACTKNWVGACTYQCESGSWKVANNSCAIPIIHKGTGRIFLDGTIAKSCEGYRRPAYPYAYQGAIGDGTYAIDPDGPGGRAPVLAYCNMTLFHGGWTMIANVPPAPNGWWERNAGNFRITGFPPAVTVLGMMRPADVDATRISYKEVLFLDTNNSHWFVVPKTSRFYLNNYKGVCGDMGIYVNSNFPVIASSNGRTTLFANWDTGCPNPWDFVTDGVALQVRFDTSQVAPNATLIRGFVR